MLARFLWRSLKSRYRDHRAELEAIRNAVKPDDVICDIGANKGSYLWWLSRWVPQGQVYAFEPQQFLAAYLQRVCAMGGLRNVTVEAKAVAAQSGTLQLQIPGTGDSPGASLNRKVAEREACRSVEVPVVALDDYLPVGARVGALKIDAEGAELAVFQGASRILSEQAPLLVFECEQRHLDEGTVADVFAFLKELGYRGSFIQGKGLHPIEQFDPSVHQAQTGVRFWDEEAYVNNFVFSR